ncbi:hypothetical protein [Mesorhizobium shangrilense]|uniref:Uncharacterized protein n=1 Tax=Mesorhizobium shangrilense TaxID=460060 RepID=A0ABV2DLS4_9HYPH
MEKIAAATVVVADVTPVGTTSGFTHGRGEQVGAPKKLMNSNVAIELGYALHALSDRRLLMVCNSHYGDRADLPFDLAHKAGPVFYRLAPGADRQAIAVAKWTLTEEFVTRLRDYLDVAATSSVPEFQPTLSTYVPAAYFPVGATLARIGVQGVDELFYTYQTDKLCFLRLIPTRRLDNPLPRARLLEKITYAPLLTPQASGGLTANNDFGAIRFEPASNPPSGEARLGASIQLFRNGELWAVGAKFVITERGLRPAHVVIPLVPLSPFEKAFHQTLRQAVDFRSEHLELHVPWRVVLGVTGVAGVHYGVNSDTIGPVSQNEVVFDATLNIATDAAVTALAVRFFEEVYDASGYPRPAGLHGIPPR